MKQSISLTFTYENPNPPGCFGEALKKILLEKLFAESSSPDNRSSKV